MIFSAIPFSTFSISANEAKLMIEKYKLGEVVFQHVLSTCSATGVTLKALNTPSAKLRTKNVYPAIA
jgi:hypothetical protein